MNMDMESSEAKLRSPKGFINLEEHQQYFNNIMEGNKMEHKRSFTQGHGKKMLSMNYFSLESIILLLGLTASLLLLPLMLPPLPPPPFMLLLVPIFILVVLMILAFMPSNVRNVTCSYL
uniref:ARGOS n=1 Tax=Solanum lycopersicum TaxID=4081 RepID=C7SFP7_SOLLC|nr:ARGOS [Solanum lycopersicum]